MSTKEILETKEVPGVPRLPNESDTKYFNRVLRKKHGLRNNLLTEAERAAKQGHTMVSLDTAATEAHARESHTLLEGALMKRYKKLPRKLKERILEEIRSYKLQGMSFGDIKKRFESFVSGVRHPGEEDISAEREKLREELNYLEDPEATDHMIAQLEELKISDGDDESLDDELPPSKPQTIH